MGRKSFKGLRPFSLLVTRHLSLVTSHCSSHVDAPTPVLCLTLRIGTRRSAPTARHFGRCHPLKPWWVKAPLRKGQECVDVILRKLQDTGLTLPKDLFDICCGAIAAADPDDLRWKSENETALMKIGILRHDDEVVIPGKFPNDCVIYVQQTQQSHMGRTGVDSLQCSHQARR